MELEELLNILPNNKVNMKEPLLVFTDEHDAETLCIPVSIVTKVEEIPGSDEYLITYAMTSGNTIEVQAMGSIYILIP